MCVGIYLRPFPRTCFQIKRPLPDLEWMRHTCLCIYTPNFTVLLLFLDRISDINECTSDGHGCSKNASCINTMGSYRCQCIAGHTGDGMSCSGMYVFVELSLMIIVYSFYIDHANCWYSLIAHESIFFCSITQIDGFCCDSPRLVQLLIAAR